MLAAAQQLFLTAGFAGTSMDAVSEAAGVSKLTAYNYFGSKQALFAQAVAAKAESAFVGIDLVEFGGHDVRTALIAFGHAFLKLVLDPTAVAVHGLVVAERERAPELGRLFYENAIRPVGEKLAATLARHEGSGEISVDGPRLVAAQDLLALWRGRPFMMIELVGEPMDREELAAHVAHCADLCLHAWSPR